MYRITSNLRRIFIILSEVKIIVCFKFEVSAFILRKSRKNNFLRKTNGLAKRSVNFTE